VPTATPFQGSLQLDAPGDGTAAGGKQQFQWVANFTPPAGQAFELVFWKPGQNPLQSSFGLAAPTTGNSASPDLDDLDSKLGDLLNPGEYLWGVLLVQTEPYQRLQFLGQQRTFIYTRSSGGDGGGNDNGGQNSGEGG
jgi:hypothetical protein